jgi:hypothetical protein
MNACNIGPKAQSRRKWIGCALIVVAGILTGYFLAHETPSMYRIIVFPFFAGGFISLLQAERKVCVWNAHQKTVEAE